MYNMFIFNMINDIDSKTIDVVKNYSSPAEAPHSLYRFPFPHTPYSKPKVAIQSFSAALDSWPFREQSVDPFGCTIEHRVLFLIREIRDHLLHSIP